MQVASEGGVRGLATTAGDPGRPRAATEIETGDVARDLATENDARRHLAREVGNVDAGTLQDRAAARDVASRVPEVEIAVEKKRPVQEAASDVAKRHRALEAAKNVDLASVLAAAAEPVLLHQKLTTSKQKRTATARRTTTTRPTTM